MGELHIPRRPCVCTRQWAEAVQDNRDFEMQYRMVNADGEPFEVIGRAVVMKDQTGRAIGYYGTIQKLDNTH